MNKHPLTSFLACVMGALLMVSCNNPYPGFKKSETGIYYRVYEHQDTAAKIQTGDVVAMNLKFYNKDTVIFSYFDNPDLPRVIDITESAYRGDIYDAFRLLSNGDSATVILQGDSLFLKLFGFDEVPGFIRKNPMVWADIRVTDVTPKEAAAKIMAEQKAEYQALVSKMKSEEPGLIAGYILDHKITVKPKESGLYYIELKAGTGPKAEKGRTVKVNYTAMLIDGQIIETSIEEVARKNSIFDTLFDYKPMEFLQGDLSTIPGWEEGISYMKKGGKARLIVPSSLAYGEDGLEDLIPPYSPVVYEIEVLEVK